MPPTMFKSSHAKLAARHHPTAMQSTLPHPCFIWVPKWQIFFWVAYMGGCRCYPRPSSPPVLQVATFLDENWRVITSCAAHKKLLKFEKGTDFGGSVVEEDQHLLDQFDPTKAAQMVLLRVVPDGATTHLKVMVLMTWMGDGVWSMHLQDVTGHAGILQKQMTQMTQYHEAMYALQAPMMVVNDDLQVTPIVCPTLAGQNERGLC